MILALLMGAAAWLSEAFAIGPDPVRVPARVRKRGEKYRRR